MAFTDLFESGEHSRNLGHFASIANMALVNGELSHEEEKMLKRFANKLDIDESEYERILKDPSKYPINPPNSAERRLERIHDLFQMVFADHEIDDHERFLIEKYAIGLGYDVKTAQHLIKRSIPGYRARIRPIVSRITIHWPSFYNVVTGKTLALPNLIALQHIPLSPAGVIAKRPAPIALPNSCAAEWRMAPDAVFSPYASVWYFTPHMVHSQYNLL